MTFNDPIEDAMDIVWLAIIGAAAYFLYELYADPESAIAQGACNTLGVGCAPGTIPTSGLGAWAWQAGWWWGEASSAVGNAANSVENTAGSIASGTRGAIDMVGSVVAGIPTPSAPGTPGLPAGYNPATGQIDGSPSGASSTF